MRLSSKVLAILTVMCMLIGLSAPALAETARQTPYTVAVVGTGTVSMQPEQATVRLGVQEQAASIVKAQRVVNEKISSVIDALVEKGVPKENISVSYVNIYANYDYNQMPYKIIGYNASHQLLVKTTAVKTVGELVDAALKAGANQLDGIDFSAADGSTAYKKAMELAMKDAQGKAETLAAAAGQTLGAIEKIAEKENYYGGTFNGMYDKMSGEGDAGTEILSGRLEVTASVEVTYSFAEEN